jgi:hypothetical protein
LGGAENGIIDLGQFYAKLSCWKDYIDKKDEEKMDNLNADFFHVVFILNTIGFR